MKKTHADDADDADKKDKGLSQITQITQIKNYNRYGMNRISNCREQRAESLGQREKSSRGTTDFNDGF